VVRRFRNRRSICVKVEWTTGERSSPQACKPQARAPQTDMELSSALVWNVSRSAFKRHKATDENAHFCRDAIVRPPAKDPHLQNRPSESGNRQQDCSDPQTAVVVNHRDRPG